MVIRTLLISLLLSGSLIASDGLISGSADGWTHTGPREDALPEFKFLPKGGPINPAVC